MGTSLFIRVPFTDMHSVFYQKLLRHGFPEENALILADVFTNNSVEGVYSHGVNRFPRFIQYTSKGYVQPQAKATLSHASGCVEQWDGRLAAGPLNALEATDRAMVIAEQFGIGCVALANTNHWMRGGYYGQHAAKKGYIFIGWSNTTSNMPPWGSAENKLGNNPLVMGVPYKDDPIVLDMAMSQYSYGALDHYRQKNDRLPVPGGYDSTGKLSDDAAAILETRRVLPAGFWKGSGLSLLLDILAAVLSGGLSTKDISKLPAEHSLSQIFIALNISSLGNYASIAAVLEQIVQDFHSAKPLDADKLIRYPGERASQVKEQNLVKGIPVSQTVWTEITAL
jgi:3-dehydro-L-gulonate 2-dehydrogenase